MYISNYTGTEERGKMQSAGRNLAPLIHVKEDFMYNSNGERCMVVIDPETRKLLIPCKYVYPTRAQQRTTTPSLCLLFLRGRCRQGAECHQVHAMLNIVTTLRSRVGNLPWCCVFHGDEDIGNVLGEGSWLSNVFIHIPESTYEGGFIPLSRTGYTVPVAKLLNNLPHGLCRTIESYRRSVLLGRTPLEGPPRIVLDAWDIPICRLHILDRCRYAEECGFLHLCKEVAAHNPQLPLGRLSRSKAMKKGYIFAVSDTQTSHMFPLVTVTSPNRLPPTPCANPSYVRGFSRPQRGTMSGSGLNATSLYLTGEKGGWNETASVVSAADSPSFDQLTDEDKSVTGSLISHCAPPCGNEYSYKRLWMRSCQYFFVSSKNKAHFEEIVSDINKNTAELHSEKNCCDSYAMPIILRDEKSNLMATFCREKEDTVSSTGALMNYQYVQGGMWIHDPYHLTSQGVVS